MDDELIELSRAAIKAIGDGDNGRSQHLLAEVDTVLNALDADELEWLSMAVSNAAMGRYVRDHAEQQAAHDGDLTTAGAGEVWDI